MGAVGNEDAFVIELGKKEVEPHVISVICPDRTGLGCGICRLILDFGLYITKGDVTRVLTELELSVQTVKYCLPLSARDRLHTKERPEKILEQFRSVLGESCISCELKLAGPEYECHQNIPSLSIAVAEELFTSEQLTDADNHVKVLSDDMKKLKNSTITVNNSLSPAYTLLQIHCVDHRGLLYDVLRTLKDSNILRFSPQRQGYRDLDLLIQQKDGNKIMDHDKQNSLCSRLKAEMLHPLHVIITHRGPDTELVANPVELSRLKQEGILLVIENGKCTYFLWMTIVYSSQVALLLGMRLLIR